MQSVLVGEKVKFVKMQGLGNDFLVTDSRFCSRERLSDVVTLWADRHCGVGFDQLLYLSPSQSPGVDLDYEIYNADGSKVPQCGNGVRCVARYAFETKLCCKKTMVLQTSSVLMEATLSLQGSVSVNMGMPNFSPESLPFNQAWPLNEAGLYCPGEPADNLVFGVVSMGNPHAVLPVKDIRHHDIKLIGKYLCEHANFSQGVNVGFVTKLSDAEVELVVYERGVGLTQACGSGACAAVAILRHLGQVSERVLVRMPGGVLCISWNGPGDGALFMEGPAEFVFEGQIALPS